VSFSDRLEAEVPLLDPHCTRRYRPPAVPGARSTPYRGFNEPGEVQARANMAKLVQNNERLFGNFNDCLEFVRLIRKDLRSAGKHARGKLGMHL